MNFYRRSAPNTSNGWRDKLAYIQELRAELAQMVGYSGTEYRQASFKRELAAMREQHRQAIGGGIIGEFNDAMAAYEQAGDYVNKTLQREINSWDVSQLNQHMALAHTQIDQALSRQTNPYKPGQTAGGALEKLFNEAAASGDKNRQRAFYETLVAAQLPHDQESRFITNRLQSQAEERLSTLRTTPEIERANQKQEETWAALVAKREEVRTVALELGEADPARDRGSQPFPNAYNRIDVQGRRILSPDDPEVTGVSWERAGMVFGG